VIEILNLDVTVIENVVILVLVAFYIPDSNQLCCSVSEFAMLNECC